MLHIEDILVYPEGKGKNDFLRADGIWDFLAEPPGSGRGTQMERETLQYQGKYQSVSGAASYNVGYQQRKQRRTQKEIVILRRLLRGLGGRVLDMPCGGGRLSPVIAESATAIIEMDIAIGQLLYGKENCRVPVPQAWVRASGFQIPLKDRSVDGSICIRLSHHLHALGEKELLLSELLRVARRFVVFSFVDGSSMKYTLRRWRTKLTGAPLKRNAMEVQEIRDISAKYGGRMLACPSIGPFQAHRYALIEKTSG